MKIFMSADTYLPLVGGAEVHVFELRKRLEALGHQVTLFVTDPASAPEDQAFPAIREAWSLKRIPKLLRKIWTSSAEADVFHLHHCYRLGVLVGLVAFLRRKPCVVTLHGLGLLDIPGNSWFYDKVHRAYRWWSLHFATHIISTSQDLAEVCRKYVERPMTMIPNGLDTQAFNASDVTPSQDPRFEGASPMLLTVRRLVPKNGVQYLISALPFLLKKYPTLKLVMIGDGRLREHIEARAKRLGVYEACIFLGALPNAQVAPIARRADVVVFPSTAESTSIACAEMMAMQKKVVASRVGGLIELLGAQEERGWLVKLVPWESCDYTAPDELPVDRYEALANTISKALEEKTPTKVTAAMEFAKTRLDWSVVVSETAKTYLNSVELPRSLKHGLANAWRLYKKDLIFCGAFFMAYALIIASQIFQPLDSLVTSVLPDDAFYYFQIAKNIAHHYGSTFDRLAPTNGYHPLWMMIVAGLFSIFPTDPSAIQASLTLSAACYLLTAVLVYIAMRMFVPQMRMRAIFFSLWFLSPFVYLESVNGLETSLSMLCLATFVFCLAKWSCETASKWRLGLLGAVGGLMLLSRTDFIIYYIFLIGYQLYLGYPTGKGVLLKRALCIFLGTGFVLLPWLVWNLYTFGTVVQVSGSAYVLAQYTRVFVLSTVNVGKPWLFVFSKAAFSTTIYGLKTFFEQMLCPWLAFVFAGFLLCSASVAKSKNIASAPDDEGAHPTISHGLQAVMLPLLTAGLCYFFVQVSLRWSIRSWYFVHLQVLVWLGIAYFYYQTHAFMWTSKLTGKRLLPLVAIILLSWTWAVSKEAHLRYENQQEFIQAAHWMNSSLPTGSRVGVFNAGIQAFYSTHQIVNLDGLVNNSVYPYLKERNLVAYLEKEKIEFVSDFYKVIFGKFGASWGVDPYGFFTQGEAITTLKMFDPKGIYLFKLADQAPPGS